MAVQKFSQITAAPSNFASTDSLVGVRGLNTDLLFGLTQLGPTIGTTPITGGTTNRLFYDNAGVIGEATVGSGLSFSGGSLTAPAAGITINSSAITGTTDMCVLFDKAGVISEDTNFEWDYTNHNLNLGLGNSSSSLVAYNTSTSGNANYERGVFSWSNNILLIGTQKLGSGSTRNLQFLAGNAVIADYAVTTAGTWSFGPPMQFGTNSANFFAMQGAGGGSAPSITATGSDTNVGLNIQLKGTGGYTFANANGTVNCFIAGAFASAVNYLQIWGNTTGNGPFLSAIGSDTNVDLWLQSQGTSYVRFNSSSHFSANGAVATALTSVGPTGSHTTVQEWLTIKNASGTIRYIPCF